MLYEDLCDWINGLPYWQKKIAIKVLNNQVVTDKDCDDIYNIFKIKNKLCNDQNIEFEEISLPVQCIADNENQVLSWNGVRNIQGINALKEGEGLEISNKITLFYGENGSGKTGYTRLFNNAFVSKGDKSLLPNIFSDKVSNTYAEFIFSDSTGENVLKYPEEKEANEFRRVMVFDTTSAVNDMMLESELSFIPSEFRFFEEFLNASIEIGQRLEDEIKQKNIDNPVEIFFDKDTEIKKKITLLSSDTDIIKFKEDVSITDEEKDNYAKVKVEKSKLVGLNIDNQLVKLKKIEKALTESKQVAVEINQLFNDANLQKNKGIISDLKSKENILKTEGIEQFAEDEILNLGGKEWKEFIIAAQNYYKSIDEKIENCIFCGQKIDGISVIEKYWTYLQSQAEKNYNILIDSIRTNKKQYENLEVKICDNDSLLYEWLIEKDEDKYTSLNDFYKTIEELRIVIIENLDNKTWDETIQSLVVDINFFDNYLKEIQDSIQNLNIDEVKKQICNLEKIENEFLDKKKVQNLMSQIEEFIIDKKWVKIAEKSKVKTRNITNKQKELFGKYVTEDYINIFNEECSKLKADFKAEIVQRGSKGKTLKKLAIKGHVPGEVLSEGEQRAIAIANFLAEVKMQPNNVAIIFDDPVSSLDHKRRNVIAKRLAEEAAKRQVIIMTHDITFFMELKSTCEQEGIEYLMETVRKVGNEPGNISQEIPWQGMSVKERTKRLNELLQELKKYEKSVEMDEYFFRAKMWCELLRESWERAVEEILFNDAIQRYNPCIQTQRLKKAPFTVALYNQIEAGMSECSNWVHDRARGLNADVPTTEQLKDSISVFENFVKSNRK